uniref:hypothetical protein n=1 Tax=Streptomyces sp. IBSBF 2435 TaxID=2903531 RepID=UPI002FDBD0F9
MVAAGGRPVRLRGVVGVVLPGLVCTVGGEGRAGACWAGAAASFSGVVVGWCCGVGWGGVWR